MCFVVVRAELSGIDPLQSVWLVSTIGITNTIGRIVCGMISSLPGVDALYVNNAALTIGGIATIIIGLPDFSDFEYQIVYASVFGLAIGKEECGQLHIL